MIESVEYERIAQQQEEGRSAHMSNGPMIDPHPQFQPGAPVWFSPQDTRMVGQVEQVQYQVGVGYRYLVRTNPMAVFWVEEADLHPHQREGRLGA